MLIACALACLAAAPEAPPPALQVTAEAADVYRRVPSVFSGVNIDFKTQHYEGVKRVEQAVLFGNSTGWDHLLFPGIRSDIQFKLSVKAGDNAPHLIHAKGSIIDYAGAEMQKIAVDISVKAGETAQQGFAIKPVEGHSGPFYLVGTWVDDTGNLSGEFSGAAADPNMKLIVEDFELVRYPGGGGPLENSPLAGA